MTGNYKHESARFYVRCKETEAGAFAATWVPYNEATYLRRGTADDIREHVTEDQETGAIGFIDLLIEDDNAPDPEYVHEFKRLITGKVTTRKFVPARMTFLAI